MQKDYDRTKNIIPGYTGHIPAEENVEDILQINQAKSHVPGYAGYIPSKKSENLYGKTYAKVTYLSSTQTHHKGSDLPPQLRYVSTIKDEFRPSNEVKVKELERMKVIEDAKKTSGQFYGKEVMGFSSFDKQTLPLLVGQFQEKEQTNASYEQIAQLAHGQKPKGSSKPRFPANCHSLLKKCLTDDVWEQCKDRVDAFGCRLSDIIRSGIENLDSGVGVYAGSADSYKTFAPLFDKIIFEYHGHGPLDRHTSDWNVNKIPTENLDPNNEFIVSTRIRFARNAAEYPLGTFISKQQRLELEQKAIKAFNTFQGDLKGKYYSLGSMSDKERQQMIDDHFLFKEGDRFLESCGLNREWPEGRGIFHNNNKTFLIWLNEEDQFRVISMQQGGDIREVFDRLGRAQKHIEKTLKFSQNDHLGAITTCPTNLGTGVRASVHVKLPLLSSDHARFQAIADKHHVQIRGSAGEHSESVGGIYDVSNKRRLGFSEVQLVLDMYYGVQEMIQTEIQLRQQQQQQKK